MPRIAYENKRLHNSSLRIIAQANDIIRSYMEQGYSLTLRQLYYQFVARDLLRNSQKSYSRLGDIISSGRMNGLVDWNAIVDRTRSLSDFSSWGEPSDILASAANSYRVDLWENQPTYVEVWVEKDALSDVVAMGCAKSRAPHFVCRGYTSQSAMWRAGQRLAERVEQGQDVRIIHLGDHDPSGIDMTRDIADRLYTFVGRRVPVDRIALNMDQVEEYAPPPNPAKMTDSRADAYVERFGRESWELDALEPKVLVELIETELKKWVAPATRAEDLRREESERASLRLIAENADDVFEYVESL